jgi:superfamily II DNA or RNA helicase
MVKQAVIRRGGPFLQLSLDGETPLPRSVTQAIEEKFCYTHLDFQHGGYDPETEIVSGPTVNAESRRLYQYDDHGRFCCQKGYRYKVEALLTAAGYVPQLVDVDPPKDQLIYEPQWDRIVDRFVFRPKQDVCMAQIAMHDCGVIDAVTAFGKMYIIAMVCVLYPQAKIDIVTKSTEVVRSLKRLLTKYVPSIGQVGGGRNKQGRVTIYTAGSVHKSDYDADIVLVDEIHEMMTDNFTSKLGRYHSSRMYGFTASKETRADNAHHRMEAFVGPTIFYMDYPEAESLGLVVPMVVQWLDVEMDWNPAAGLTQLAAKKRAGIWRNDYRNQIIARAANSFLADGMQTLVLVDTVDHALHLRTHMPGFQLCCGENSPLVNDPVKQQLFVDAGLMTYGEELMTAVRREQLQLQFECREVMGVIATSVWATGVSFDSLQVLVRANGGDSETGNVQQPGRVCRTDETSGKDVGILVDMFDCWDTGFQTRSKNRRRSYASREWVQYTGRGKLWASRRRRKRAEL